MQTASDAPRWRIEPDGVLWLEQGFSARTAQSLIDMGHGVKHDVPLDQFGGEQYIKKLDQGYGGESDHRKDGQASGF